MKTTGVRQHFRLAAMLILAASFSACTAKITGGDDKKDPTPEPPQKPDMHVLFDGDWDSGCAIRTAGTGTRRLRYNFKDNTVHRIEEYFKDGQCSTAAEFAYDQKGTYRTIAKNADKSYEVTYEFVDKNVTYFFNEYLIIDNGILYSSNRVTSTGNGTATVTVDRSLPMIKTIPTPSQPANPPALPDSCVNYTGKYMMNSDLFDIQQTDCKEVRWIKQATYFDPRSETFSYIPDGVPRKLSSGLEVAASFKMGNLVLSYIQQGKQRVDTYTFEKVPCNLYNPDGRFYLTRNSTVNGVPSPSLCAFWAKN